MPVATSRSTVQSVTRALDLLETLALPGELGLVELAARTGLQPSTVHRLLSTLVTRRYVVQSADTGRYLLGYKVNELAGHVRQRTEELRGIARPHLETIQKVTRESANLTVLEPPSVVYVDQVEGSRSVRMFARIGAAVPAYSTAAGKAMLAHIRPTALLEFCGDEPFVQLTPHTIRSYDALAEELSATRDRGFAIDHEEQELGVACVAAPIFDHAGSVVAAISVSAPTARIHAADPPELGDLLKTRADAISRELGFVSRPVENGPPSRRLKLDPSGERPPAGGRWPARP
jgi:IclR family acetate operon transcriptional repressor